MLQRDVLIRGLHVAHVSFHEPGMSCTSSLTLSPGPVLVQGHSAHSQATDVHRPLSCLCLLERPVNCRLHLQTSIPSRKLTSAAALSPVALRPTSPSVFYAPSQGKMPIFEAYHNPSQFFLHCLFSPLH